MKKLLIVPSEPLVAYERKGILRHLQHNNYFNPRNAFEEVLILSPKEKPGERMWGDIRVIGVSEREFPTVAKSFAPDLIRAYGAFWACDLAVYSRIGCPVCVSVHDVLEELIHPSIVFADKVLCTSLAVSNAVISAGVDPRRCVLRPNWVDHEVFYPRECSSASVMPDVEEDQFVILHVGRKEKQKNLETVIETLRFLPEKYIVFFVGQGDIEVYQKLANSVGVAHRCRWIKSIENDEMPLWYSCCHVMCTPSLWEGFGIVFIEAAACGACIVTSDIGPMNEFLKNEESALLVHEYTSAEEIAKAILRCSNSLLREKLAQGAVSASMSFDKKKLQNDEADAMLSIIKNDLNFAARSGLRWRAAVYFFRQAILQYEYLVKGVRAIKSSLKFWDKI